MMQLHSTKKAREITGRPGFGLAITYARMKQREKALEALEEAIGRLGGDPPGDAIAHVHVTLGAHDDAILNSNARVSNVRHPCSGLASLPNSCRFVRINVSGQFFKESDSNPKRFSRLQPSDH